MPKGQQTVRYYGVYSNKTRDRPREAPRAIRQADHPSSAKHLPDQINRAIQGELLLVEPSPKRSARLMRPLWRDLIIQVWGGDPLKCPCCPGTMKVMRPMLKPGEVEFFLKLHGLWEGLVRLPRPPPPPFDIEQHRGIGGVLDAGVAVARRVSTPCGAC